MLVKDKEEKRKKSKGKEEAEQATGTGQPSGQATGQHAGQAERIINDIIREARAGGGEDLFPTVGSAMDDLKQAFCGATFCLPAFKNERFANFQNYTRSPI